MAKAGPYTKTSTKSIGKPIVIPPPVGNSTGINSTKIDMARKKTNISHILENDGKAGIKYTKRAIADVVITAI